VHNPFFPPCTSGFGLIIEDAGTKICPEDKKKTFLERI